MPMTASCMFPLHQGTLLQHGMVYSHVWPLSSYGCRRIKWNWTQIKPNSSILGTNDRGANKNKNVNDRFNVWNHRRSRFRPTGPTFTSPCFPLNFSVSKLTMLNLIRILGLICDKIVTFRSHISAVCSLCFYHMRDLRRIHRHLDPDSAKLLAAALVSSRLNYCNSLSYGIADIDLTRVQVCTESTGPPGDKVSSIYSQSSTASFPSLVASKV